MRILGEAQLDSLNAQGLRTALSIQVELVEHLGPVKAALCGLHAYLFTRGTNTAFIDHLLGVLEAVDLPWQIELKQLIEQSAQLRLANQCQFDARQPKRAEALALLTLAEGLLHETDQSIPKVTRYQVYACSHLLGEETELPFFTQEQLGQLLSEHSFEPEVVYIRSFAQRLRKPELIKRELARHFAPIDDLLETPDLTFIDP